MMLLGLIMRLAQAQWINVQPDFFYVVMTMHGAGMVGIAGLSGAAVMWYFVGNTCRFRPRCSSPIWCSS